MPMKHLLANSKLPPDEQHVLELAFNYTLKKLDLVNRHDPVCEMVARKVLEVRRRCARCSADAIADIAARELGR